MYTSINKNSIIFLSVFLHAAHIYVSTKYVQDTALGTVNIARKQVRQAPCSHRAYILVGETSNLRISQLLINPPKRRNIRWP